MKICYDKKRFNSSTRLLIQQAEAILEDYQKMGYNMTLRQLFYQFVRRDLFPKEHRDSTGVMTKNHLNNYKMLGEAMGNARLSGLIDWSHLEDRHRSVTNWRYDTSPKETIEKARRQYNIDHWTTQPVQVEVWVEKAALADIMEQVCGRWGVPVFACKGYGSVSSKYDAWNRILDRWNENNQKTHILHFGDHDPSGIDMTRDITDSLAVFQTGSPDYSIDGWDGSDLFSVDRLALNMKQIRKLNPPPQPNKGSDPREKWYTEKYGPHSWELDALDPPQLTSLVEEAVEAVISWPEWEERATQQRTDFATFDKIVKGLNRKPRKPRKRKGDK